MGCGTHFCAPLSVPVTETNRMAKLRACVTPLWHCPYLKIEKLSAISGKGLLLETPVAPFEFHATTAAAQFVTRLTPSTDW